VRIVAGRLGGRSLKAPPGDATRPTGARVKEALFSILSDVVSCKVLDLYAGSGALGIEALSRGAAFGVFVEAGRPALSALRENLIKLDLAGSSKVLPVRVELAHSQLQREGPFDLTLCDPPWRDALAALAQLQTLASLGVFAAQARVVLEHSAKDPIASRAGAGRLLVTDERRWGDTAVTFFTLNSA
jgi:16S rRNA (guanine966-N2)-methyltransferase